MQQTNMQQPTCNESIILGKSEDWSCEAYPPRKVGQVEVVLEVFQTGEVEQTVDGVAHPLVQMATSGPLSRCFPRTRPPIIGFLFQYTYLHQTQPID